MPAPVRLALITDLHLGDLFGNRQLQRLQQILSQENIDLLLIPGDIMDDNTQAFERQQMAPTLRQVFTTPTTATIATLGNHDLYQNSAYTSITQAITNAGALLLNDQVASITVSKNNQHTTSISSDA
ncbi:metallophosphoesterase [Rappaport israeli]|uniref:metallophosphoesterase n=1 Tax=Rappaport israeli TaxID=1839807 RepID=UPI00093184B6|nr:metallophosphoesterase [Rappaport israeli]